MRSALLIATAAMLAAGPVLAQSMNTTAATPTTTPRTRAYVGGTDHGPFTREASSAYQGGGVVLQGAPGAPPPVAEPTPPGQTPRNMVPR